MMSMVSDETADFGDRMGVVADSSRNPLSTRSMWRATGADGAEFARRYWLSPNSANAWPLQGQIHMVAFLISNGTLQWPRAHIRARYMMVALLDSAILRNLHLSRTTLYYLCDEDDEALPVIIGH
jgi:hypothetical protein